MRLQEHHKLHVEEFSPVELAAAEQRMAPGVMCSSGYLAADESLTEVVERDLQLLEGSGITPQQMGDRLDYLTLARGVVAANQYRKTEDSNVLHTSYEIEGHNVAETIWMGGVFCGFNYTESPTETGATIDSCGYGYGDYVIDSKTGDEQLAVPMLGIHMLRHHDFFQGSTPYRIEPLKALATLGLAPDVDYAPTFQTENVWRRGGSISGGTLDIQQELQTRYANELERVVDQTTVTDDAGNTASLYLVAGDPNAQRAVGQEEQLLYVTSNGVSMNPGSTEPIEVFGRSFYQKSLHPGVGSLYAEDQEVLTGWQDQPEECSYLK